MLELSEENQAKLLELEAKLHQVRSESGVGVVYRYLRLRVEELKNHLAGRHMPETQTCILRGQVVELDRIADLIQLGKGVEER